MLLVWTPLLNHCSAIVRLYLDQHLFLPGAARIHCRRLSRCLSGYEILSTGTGSAADSLSRRVVYCLDNLGVWGHCSTGRILNKKPGRDLFHQLCCNHGSHPLDISLRIILNNVGSNEVSLKLLYDSNQLPSRQTARLMM